jgi:hypothetical protein
MARGVNDMTRMLVAVVTAILVAGCGTAIGVGAGAEPRPLPEPSTEPRSEQLPNHQVRFWPHSAAVEEEVRYHMSAYTHCGLDYLFDFDGSFWEVAAAPDEPRGSVLNDPADQGVVTLVDPDTALYESSLGAEFRLIRIAGPRDVDVCD